MNSCSSYVLVNQLFYYRTATGFTAVLILIILEKKSFYDSLLAFLLKKNQSYTKKAVLEFLLKEKTKHTNKQTKKKQKKKNSILWKGRQIVLGKI